VPLPKLDAQAARLLAAATEHARRRRHALVEPLHLVVAACRSFPRAPSFSRRRLDPRALDEVASASLDELEAIGGYRDARSALPLSPSLEALFAAAPWVHRLPLARMSVHDVLETLLSDASVARAIVDVPTRDYSAAQVSTRASALAAIRGHEIVVPSHAARALLDDAFLVEAVRALRADEARVRGALDERLDEDARSARSPRRTQAPRAREDLAALVEYADAVGADADASLPPRAVLAVRLLADVDVVTAFARAGIDAAEVAHLLVHGTAPLDVAARVSDDALLEVVLHNDDVTTHETIVDLLVEDFGMARAPATRLLLTVQASGEAPVGTFRAQEARARRNAAILRARAAGAPLRVTLRRPSRD
jgi:ATP-dependent Clp protease adapter protein ClpS